MHSHVVQGRFYHGVEGEALMEIDGEKTVVRKHDVILPAAGVELPPEHGAG